MLKVLPTMIAQGVSVVYSPEAASFTGVLAPVPGVLLHDPYATAYGLPPPHPSVVMPTQFPVLPQFVDAVAGTDGTGSLEGEELLHTVDDHEYTGRPSREEYFYGSYVTFEGFADVIGQCFGLTKKTVMGAPRLGCNRLTEIPKTDWRLPPWFAEENLLMYEALFFNRFPFSVVRSKGFRNMYPEHRQLKWSENISNARISRELPLRHGDGVQKFILRFCPNPYGKKMSTEAALLRLEDMDKLFAMRPYYQKFVEENPSSTELEREQFLPLVIRAERRRLREDRRQYAEKNLPYSSSYEKLQYDNRHNRLDIDRLVALVQSVRKMPQIPVATLIEFLEPSLCAQRTMDQVLGMVRKHLLVKKASIPPTYRGPLFCDESPSAAAERVKGLFGGSRTYFFEQDYLDEENEDEDLPPPPPPMPLSWSELPPPPPPLRPVGVPDDVLASLGTLDANASPFRLCTPPIECEFELGADTTLAEIMSVVQTLEGDGAGTKRKIHDAFVDYDDRGPPRKRQKVCAVEPAMPFLGDSTPCQSDGVDERVWDEM